MFLLCCTLVCGTIAGCGDENAETRSSSWLGVSGETAAGIDATVTAITSANTLPTGGKMPLVVLVYDKYGHRAADGTTIVFATRLGSSIDQASSATTKDGVFQTLITAGDQAGVETVTVSTPHAFVNTTFQIVTQPQPVTLVKVSPVSDSVALSGTMPVIVFVSNESGVPVDDTVTMHSTAGGTFEAASGKSEKGVFLTTYTAPAAQGVDWLTAIVNGRVASTSIAVKP